MLDFPRWKVILIVGVCLLGFLLALPNFLSEEQRDALPDAMPDSTLNLGLDLRGGVHLLLEADTEDVIASRLENLAGQVRDIRRDVRGLNFRRVRIEGRSVRFEVTREEQIAKAEEELAPLTRLTAASSQGFMGGGVRTVRLSQDGTQFTLTLTEEGIETEQRDAVQRAMEVVRKRIDPEGTREITLQPQGDRRIILQVPGADDPDALLKLIQTTAKLTFHDVVTDVSQQDVARGRLRPSQKALPSESGGVQVIRKRVIVSGEELTDAKATYDENGQPAVSFSFDAGGSRKFARHTRNNVGRPFAIVLDEKIISAPVIRSPIVGGSGIITGNFTIEEAQRLSTMLRAGSLPVPLSVLEQRTVGPDLGADSIRAGKIASMIGFVAVIVFMTMSYGRFGLAANTALIINLILIAGALSLFQATLTLPGIAGIVLTMGMAVDANVLIFERIREEQDAGRKPFPAMEQGYGQAFSTIIDANITTFIAAFILYMMGSGPVQGFAVTLGIGIVTSMFSAILLTRMILALWLRRSRPQKLPI
ncbi:protein translocase subunit SecD [Yunchengibacter salinarum]|uniref:protein translocase subunit SecD n=1 Tax=Yunchengibacter salinarum TaxID=3133399 RepID=UPI0035B59B74